MLIMVIIIIIFRIIIIIIIIYDFRIRFHCQVIRSGLISETFTPANLLRKCWLSRVHCQLNPILGIRKTLLRKTLLQ